MTCCHILNSCDSGQDGIIETRFNVLPGTIKKTEKICVTMVFKTLDGHQVKKGSDQ